MGRIAGLKTATVILISFVGNDDKMVDFRKENQHNNAVSRSETATVNLTKYDEGLVKGDRYSTIN